MNSCINKYMYEYLENMNYNIDNESSEVKKMYDELSRSVKKYFMFNPQKTNIMLGGNKEQTESKNKIGKIASIFRMYKSLKSVDLKNQSDKYRKIISNLISEIHHDDQTNMIMFKQKINEMLIQSINFENDIINPSELENHSIDIKHFFGQIKDNTTNSDVKYTDSVDDILKSIQEISDNSQTKITLMNMFATSSLKQFIKYYNNELHQNAFYGNYTIRLNNNIFINDNDFEIKIEYLKKMIDLSIDNNDMNNYYMYILLILTNQLFYDKYCIYCYLNQYTLEYYYNIITKIIKKVLKNDKSLEILFIRKYYMMIVIKLFLFMRTIIKNNDNNKIIDIRKCTNDVRESFILFNYFRPILNSYIEKQSKNIMTLLKINNHKNFKHKNSYDHISKDSDDNLSLHTNIFMSLSKGHGINLILYGFNNVGKTSELFGDWHKNKNGMIIDIISNINKLESVRFRLYELCNDGIYNYNIIMNVNAISCLSIDKINENLQNYIDDIYNTKKTYIYIPESLAYEIFDNTELFVRQIRTIRRNEKRIIDTPFGTMNAKSILIYDFQLEINGKIVPLLIFDLPCKENFRTIYQNPYFNNETIRQLFLSGGGHNETNMIEFMNKVIIVINNIANDGDVYDIFNKLIDDGIIVDVSLKNKTKQKLTELLSYDFDNVIRENEFIEKNIDGLMSYISNKQLNQSEIVQLLQKQLNAKYHKIIHMVNDYDDQRNDYQNDSWLINF